MLIISVRSITIFNSNADDLGGFYDLYHALKTEPVLGATMGAIMSTLFAVALLASGQNSTITGTLAGQIVMEGFLRLHIPNWLRRLITRSLAVIPVIVCLIILRVMQLKLSSYLYSLKYS